MIVDMRNPRRSDYNIREHKEREVSILTGLINPFEYITPNDDSFRLEKDPRKCHNDS